jgi:maltose O-acetyltransferase
MIKRLLGIFFIKLEDFRNTCIYSICRKKYKLNKSFHFNGSNILLYGEGDIIIGENSYIGALSTVQAVKGTSVEIGKYSNISHNVRIYTETDVSDQNFANQDKLKKQGSVKIGDYVWIGANVMIVPGVVIGNNSIIGANSVVTKSIDENTIVGGVPARVLMKKSTVNI